MRLHTTRRHCLCPRGALHRQLEAGAGAGCDIAQAYGAGLDKNGVSIFSQPCGAADLVGDKPGLDKQEADRWVVCPEDNLS